MAAESSCPDGTVLLSAVPFPEYAAIHDAEDKILPLWPGDPDASWELAKGTFVRPLALACDEDGETFTITCEWWTCPTKPTVIHDPNAGMWSTTIEVTDGMNVAAYRATDVNGEYDDFRLIWRRRNRKPKLH
jgi:hypothetical protein